MSTEREKKRDEEVKQLHQVSEEFKKISKASREKAKTNITIANLADSFAKHTDFAAEIIANIPPEKLNGMGNQDFKNIMVSGTSITCISGSTAAIGNAVMTSLEQDKGYKMTFEATGSLVSGGTVSLETMSKNHTDWFPNYIEIEKKYTPTFKLEKEIGSLKQNLAKIKPDISTEFASFNDKFSVWDNPTERCADIIGFRTVFYIKLMEGFLEQKYPGLVKQLEDKKMLGRRRIKIQKFMIGDAEETSVNKDFIDSAYALWQELSKQETNQDSAKQGTLGKEEVEIMFNRFISVMDSTIKIHLAHN